MTAGQEWLIDASGCAPEKLRDVRALAGLFDELIALLGLRVVEPPQWHVFPDPGGVTGLALLAESHLAIHTFPETSFAALNVYSCRPAALRPDFEVLLGRHLGAAEAVVRELQRSAR